MLLALILASAAQASALPPVVVTATRSPTDPLLVPAAVDVIQGADLRRAQPGLSLSESLRRIPGVVARERQNQAQDLQVSIRGFGARSTFGVRGVRLLTDGIPASMPDGQGQVSHFSLASASRIEVLRGPFSALYGNASGGVIELTSALPPTQPEMEVGVVAGSDGLIDASGSWRGQLDEARDFGARLDGGRAQADGYRHHSAWRRETGQAWLQGRVAGSTVTVIVNALELQADDPQGLNNLELQGDRRVASPNALRFDARKSVHQQQIGMRLVREFGGRQTLTLTGYAGQRKTAQMLTVPVAAQANPLSGGGAIDLDRHYGGLDARWQWRADLAGRPLTLTLGLQHEVADELRRGFDNFLGARLGLRGTLRREEQDRVVDDDQYLQMAWETGARWRLDAGLRRSRVVFDSRDRYVRPGNPDDSGRLAFGNVSPVLGVLFRATPWLSVYGNAGRGFETPTFAELAYRRDGAGGLNDSLKPARSGNAELGLRARRGGMEFSAAAFQARTRDELVVIANQGGRSVYANAPLSRRRGLELSWSTALATHWHASANATLLDAIYPGAGKRIPGLSRTAAWSELRWSPSTSTDLSIEGRFVGRVLADDANSAAAPAYSSFDLAAEHRAAALGLQWRMFGRINNLANRAIVGSVIVNESNGRYFEPAPGRNWLVGLSATRTLH